MAFPASQMRLATVLDQIAGTLNNLKGYAANARTTMAAGNIGANAIVDGWHHLSATRTRLQSLAATPGIGPYAQEQYGNETLNVAAEFNAVVAALTAVIDNIATSVPKDGNGFILEKQFGAGEFTYQQFTPAQTTTLRGLLSNLEGTIA